MDFSKRLTQLRERKGWNKTQTAKAIGVTVGAYANWEYGNRMPDIEKDFHVFIKMSDIFDVSLAYLINGKKTIRDFNEREREEYIEHLKSLRGTNETLSGFQLIKDTTNAIAYEDIIKTYHNWENESDDLKALLAAIFGFYEAKPHEDILHDKLIRFLVELYNSDQPSLEDNLIILDRKYDSLRKEFIRSEKNK